MYHVHKPVKMWTSPVVAAHWSTKDVQTIRNSDLNTDL